MTRDFLDYLHDIVSSLEECLTFVHDMPYEVFESDPKTIKAVLRNLETAGEAAKRVPEQFRDANPQIPWKLMAGMRDRLIHKYFDVDLRIVWGTVQRNIPEALPALRELLSRLDREP